MTKSDNTVNKNAPLVSIIIPVFNVEPYIAKCLHSVYDQTYLNYEVIIILDGGTAEERIICQTFCERDDRFILVDQENKGLSGARNTGLEKARGDYIIFLDSDDYLELDYLQKAVDTFSKTDADVVQFDFNISDTKGTYRKLITSEIDYGYHDADSMIFALAGGKMWPNIWARAYRRSLFDDIRFPEGEYWEDVAILHELFYKAKRIYYCNFSGYVYIQREDSITKITPLNSWKWRFIQYKKRYEFIRRHYNLDMHIFDRQMAGPAIDYGKWCVLTGNHSCFKNMRKWVKEQTLRLSALSHKQVLTMILLMHAPVLFCLVVYVMNIRVMNRDNRGKNEG